MVIVVFLWPWSSKGGTYANFILSVVEEYMGTYKVIWNETEVAVQR